MNTNKCYLVLPALMLVSAIGSPPAFALGGVNEKSGAAFPSKLYPPNPAAARHKYVLSCINGATGAFLDCPFTVDIPRDSQPPNAPGDNGGHAHTNDRPPSGFGELEYDGVKGEQPVSGSTGNSRAVVTHFMPEFSGKIMTRVDLKVPPPTPNWSWRCIDNYGGWRCWDSTTWRIHVMVDVRVPGLESLPDDATAPYIKVRGGNVAHLKADAYYGVPTTNVALYEIARLYQDRTDKALSVNDMSLPKGGKFDINGSWSGDHGEHRLGISADINQGGIACQKDKSLLKAVDAVIPPNDPRYVKPRVNDKPLSRLLCESGGRKHIDFDGIPVIAR